MATLSPLASSVLSASKPTATLAVPVFKAVPAYAPITVLSDAVVIAVPAS